MHTIHIHKLQSILQLFKNQLLIISKKQVEHVTTE